MKKNSTLIGGLQDGYRAMQITKLGEVGRKARHFIHLDESFPVGRKLLK